MCYPCTLYQKKHHFYIHLLRKHLRSFKWSKTLLKKETDSYILTFITILSRVSHNTTQTRPSNDVTMSLLTVFRTRYRAAFSIKTRNWTTWKILFTCFFSLRITCMNSDPKHNLFLSNVFQHIYWIFRVCWNSK